MADEEETNAAVTDLIANLADDDRRRYNQLKRSRAYYKGRLTNFQNSINANPNLSQGALESILRNLAQYETKFSEAQDLIEEEFPEIEMLKAERELFADRYFELETMTRQKLIEIHRGSSSTTAAGATPKKLNPKLPDIVIQKFDGDIRKWPAWSNMWRPMIGNRTDIDDVTKYAYLEASIIDGRAASILSSVTDSNYQTAFSRLEEVYANDPRLREQLISDLYSCKPNKDRDPKALEDFAAKIESTVAFLKSLNVPTESWDLLLIFHLTQKLDLETRKELEKIKRPDEDLTLENFLKFLRRTARMLEALHDLTFTKPKATSTPKVEPPKSSIEKRKVFSGSYVAAQPSNESSVTWKCSFCPDNHKTLECPLIKGLKPEEIVDKARKAGLCFNCLGKGHQLRECTRSKCRTCGKKHHTLIHGAKREPEAKQDNNRSEENKKDDKQNASYAHAATTLLNRTRVQTIVLPTAVVLIKASNGNFIPCRALLDSGSTVSFMTNALAHKLNLRREQVDVEVHGINDQSQVNQDGVTSVIRSRLSQYEAELDFILTKTITSSIPSQSFDITDWQIPESSLLADPSFHLRGGIDLLLGVDVFFDVLNQQRIEMSNGIYMYGTKFGYIFGGKVKTEPHVSLVSIAEVSTQLKKFWEVETCDTNTAMSLEEKAAEGHYVTHTVRLQNGHYQVALPFNDRKHDIGNSSDKAKRLFLCSERRLAKDREKQQHYRDFINEMLTLGHLEEAAEDTGSMVYYMSHHLISRPSSSTTKHRVVFNASMKSDSGVSLNDSLMTGPTIQAEVFRHLIRWRLFPVAVTADVAKMYRMVYVKPEDRDMQRIWWRPYPDQPLKPYRLTTVVYGTASAPFQAIRTLSKLAEDEVTNFPDVAHLLTDRFYVDDYIDSFRSADDAKKSKQRLSTLAAQGGFELRKWASNISELNDDITQAESTSHVLGIPWHRDEDVIRLTFSNIKIHEVVTKSSVLSEIAQIYDPLGLYAPVVLRAKVLMQKLWLVPDLGWDDQLPADLQQEWLSIRDQLTNSPQKAVSRALLSTSSQNYVLHGFCDGSETGYGASIYLVTEGKAMLVCAKSRVAPLNTLTIPRLELCAALLLANLMNKVIASLDVAPLEVYCWTDSEITLYRIKSLPGRFNVFVANRVAQIQELIAPTHWHFVPSEHNAADVASRGCEPHQLFSNDMWWSGPPFLVKNKSEWPDQKKFSVNFEAETELKQTKISAIVSTEAQATGKYNFLLRFSSYTRLIDTISFMMRFFVNCLKSAPYRNFNHLSVQEVQEALARAVRLVQREAFPVEIAALKASKLIPTSSKLIRLNPFLDEEQLLRVGGRLKNATLTFDNQHQIILPKGHFAALVMRYVHEKNLHAGPLATLNTARQRWWILGGRSLSRKTVHECVQCFKNKPVLAQQLMAQLPESRLNQARPFQLVGLDLCGPFMTRPQPRSKVLIKQYICVFTCFLTRATHLEVVTDLSTQAFMQCLRRFIARRGVPQSMMSDNATNFVGAARELKELRQWYFADKTVEEVHDFCRTEGITWSTIPPRSPHFGGLWEAMVKRVKHHLKRATKDRVFSPEQLLTLTCQIEACLNSRPLTPMTDSPDDFQALTPGHFLIGAPLTLLPERFNLNVNINSLRVWQQIQHINNQVWQRFSKDYFVELQQRQKWSKPHRNLKINDLVLMYEDNVPPAMWRLARIIQLYPGADGLVRVVKLMTSKGPFIRSVQRVAPLPINDEN